MDDPQKEMEVNELEMRSLSEPSTFPWLKSFSISECMTTILNESRNISQNFNGSRVVEIRLYDIFSASESPQKKNASNKTIAFYVAVDADFADFKSMSHQYDWDRKSILKPETNRKWTGNEPEVHLMSHI